MAVRNMVLSEGSTRAGEPLPRLLTQRLLAEGISTSLLLAGLSVGSLVSLKDGSWLLPESEVQGRAKQSHSAFGLASEVRFYCSCIVLVIAVIPIECGRGWHIVWIPCSKAHWGRIWGWLPQWATLKRRPLSVILTMDFQISTSVQQRRLNKDSSGLTNSNIYRFV